MADVMLTAPPGDGISSMIFSPVSDDLLVSSWDSTLRIYNAAHNQHRATHYFDGAILSCAYNQDGSLIYAGGLDKSLHVMDSVKNSKLVMFEHSAPIASMAFNNEYNTLITGSWDKTVNIVDSRQQRLKTTLQLPDKVYSVSTAKSKIVIATNGRHVAVYDIRNLSSPEQMRESPLKCQTRTVRCSPEGTSYSIASVEGRIGIEYFDMDPDVQSAKYAFKCHRQGDIAYPVNSLEYHPLFGTFASGGCDGIVNIWDGNNKKRLSSLGPYPTSIAALAFNNTGTLLAIASSYTFEEGEKEGTPDNVFIHTITDAEVKPKTRA